MAREESANNPHAPANFKEEAREPDLIEITARIRGDQAFALEILENARPRRAGAAVERDALIQEALDLLIEKHIRVVDLRKGGPLKLP
jgi:hypothetical protein